MLSVFTKFDNYSRRKEKEQTLPLYSILENELGIYLPIDIIIEIIEFCKGYIGQCIVCKNEFHYDMISQLVSNYASLFQDYEKQPHNIDNNNNNHSNHNNHNNKNKNVNSVQMFERIYISKKDNIECCNNCVCVLKKCSYCNSIFYSPELDHINYVGSHTSRNEQNCKNTTIDTSTICDRCLSKNRCFECKKLLLVENYYRSDSWNVFPSRYCSRPYLMSSCNNKICDFCFNRLYNHQNKRVWIAKSEHYDQYPNYPTLKRYVCKSCILENNNDIRTIIKNAIYGYDFNIGGILYETYIPKNIKKSNNKSTLKTCVYCYVRLNNNEHCKFFKRKTKNKSNQYYCSKNHVVLNNNNNDDNNYEDEYYICDFCDEQQQQQHIMESINTYCYYIGDGGYKLHAYDRNITKLLYKKSINRHNRIHKKNFIQKLKKIKHCQKRQKKFEIKQYLRYETKQYHTLSMS